MKVRLVIVNNVNDDNQVVLFTEDFKSCSDFFTLPFGHGTIGFDKVIDAELPNSFPFEWCLGKNVKAMFQEWREIGSVGKIELTNEEG